MNAATNSAPAGDLGFAERVDAKFVELIGWKPTRKVAINADRRVGPMDVATGVFASIAVDNFDASHGASAADMVAAQLARDFLAFKAERPELVWCNGPYAAYTMDGDVRRYCWLGHTEKPGTPKISVTIVTEIPEGATMLSDEAVAGLVALRKPSGYTTREVPAESFAQGVAVNRDGTIATEREP